MSRHALHSASAHPRRRLFRIMLAALCTLLVAGAVLIKLDAAPESLSTIAAKSPLIGADCPSSRLPVTTVSITAAPEL